MKRQNIRTLSLVVITLTYLIIGAAVFDHFESTNERIENTRLNYNITQFKLKYKMNDTEFNKLWHKILEKKPYYAGYQWKFVGSLYFCTVVVTLIGYGHSTPRTLPGKFFCIFYTLIGIPIFLIMFQSVGERLNSFIIFLLTKLKRKFKLKNQEVGLVELITVEGFFSINIILVASYIFMRNEDWTYFDAIYYCFITLTTIGFGDYVPLQKDNLLTNNLPYACFTILFILIGLTTLASSMNLLVLRLATINAEEQVQERLEAAEARRNAVHLDGDIICQNSRNLFVPKENPEKLDTISVCSCACLDYKLFKSNRRKNKKKFLFKKSNCLTSNKSETDLKSVKSLPNQSNQNLFMSTIPSKLNNNYNHNYHNNKKAAGPVKRLFSSLSGVSSNNNNNHSNNKNNRNKLNNMTETIMSSKNEFELNFNLLKKRNNTPILLNNNDNKTNANLILNQDIKRNSI